MEIDAAIRTVERRLRAVTALHIFIGVLVLLSLWSLCAFLLAYASPGAGRTLLVIGSILLAAAALYRFFSTKISRMEAALSLDRYFGSKERITALLELREQKDAAGAVELIRSQLAESVHPFRGGEVVPLSLGRRERRRLAVAILAWIALLCAALIFGDPFSRPHHAAVEAIQAALELPALPEEVSKELKRVEETLLQDQPSPQELGDAVARAEAAIERAQQSLSGTVTRGETVPESSAQDQKEGDRPAPGATPTATPTPPAGITPPPDQESSDGDNKGSPEEEGQSGDQNQQERQPGQQGQSGEKQQSEGSRQQQQQESKDEGDGQEQGQKGQGEGESKEGQGKGESQEESQQQGDQGAGKGDQGKESSEQGSDSKEGSGGAQEGEKQQSEQGGGQQQSGQQQSGQQGQTPDGQQSQQSQALNQAQAALNQAKQSMQENQSGQSGSAGDGQQQDGKEQSPGKEGAQGKQNQGAQPYNPGEGEQKGDQKGEKGENDRNSSPDDRADAKNSSDEHDGDAEGTASGTVDNDSGDDKNENAATKSSKPKDRGEAREYKEGDGKEWDGLGNKGFTEETIGSQNEQFDTRYTGKESERRRNLDDAQSKRTLENVILARPEAMRDEGEQPIPLEYRDVLR